uniref:Uncharacterized protein n=1 Tax=Neovison vison TaxID=452646 RepID=A0A8C7ER76_NEOVI
MAAAAPRDPAEIVCVAERVRRHLSDRMFLWE